jgi:hypothetical protein
MLLLLRRAARRCSGPRRFVQVMHWQQMLELAEVLGAVATAGLAQQTGAGNMHGSDG